MSWIKNLKVGDEVIVDRSTIFHKYNYKIEKVEKITPSGRIKTTSKKQFNPMGRGIAHDDLLLEITPERLEIIERVEIMRKIYIDRFLGKLSLERLKILLEWQNELTKKDGE